MDYLIGDLQGCCDAFERLLAEIGFSPSRDHVSVLGDLVNRGPQSLPVLRRLRGLGSAATCLLGNHDLHLLAVAYGVRPLHRNDTLSAILDAPDRLAWLDWLRQRPLAAQDNGWLLVHAGVPPQWDAADTLRHAAEAEEMLRSPGIAACAPGSPLSTITCNRALRLAVSAISDMANRPLRRIRKTRSVTSMNAAARGATTDSEEGRERSRIPA